MQNNYILAIETSCDDTSLAIIKNGDKIIKNIISSQIKDFKNKGGVIPEVASRRHFENFNNLWQTLFDDTNLTMADIDAIAVCAGPGLPGSLIVGVAQAKSLALLYNKKLIAVNHLKAHILSCNLEQKPIVYPAIALIVSGGHTEMHYLQSAEISEVIGKTSDDALGEAYDKLAKMLNLNYPGGPIIEQKAKTGQNNIKLTIPFDDTSFNFSYSGLKSELAQIIKKNQNLNIHDLCASFQSQTTTHLIKKIENAQNIYQPKTIIVCGGVIANKYLRTNLQQKFASIKLPHLSIANDNAAMIGAAGFSKFQQSDFIKLSELDIKIGAQAWS